ncbi:hypothetical protein KJ596_02565 [Patescibacteria group bacterium]|nr:hypothetical protein [Patescibacteria group bacterium]MBU1868674.1 hypothetical protein [Patescibacteria group bacterium]
MNFLINSSPINTAVGEQTSAPTGTEHCPPIRRASLPTWQASLKKGAGITTNPTHLSFAEK